VIDYYLKSAATGPVTLEIFDPGSQTVRRYSSDDPRQPVNVNTLAVLAAWQRPPEPLSAAAGAHRFVWDLRPQPAPGGRGGRGGGGGGGRGGAPMVAPGNYSVRLTVNGKSYTQPLPVQADPRSR